MDDTHNPPNWWEDDAPDSPPYDRGATQSDVNRWMRDYPGFTSRRYVHNPDRREIRLYPTEDTQRDCTRCGGMVLPYAPGRCPICLRRNNPAALPPPQTTLNICQCWCVCPPTIDDPTDGDWLPEDHDDAEEQTPVDSGTPNIETFAYALGQDNQGRTEARLYHEETDANYNASVAVHDPTNEYSSVFNNNNTVAFTEASILARAPFRMELFALLDMGYSRDDLRRMLHETRNGQLTSYLPRVFRLNEVDFPRTCRVCMGDYGPAAYDALHFNAVLDSERQGLRDEGHPLGFETNRSFFQRFSGNENTEPILLTLCPVCQAPIRDRGYLRGEPHHCSCRCVCNDPGFRTDTSSSSSSSSNSAQRG